MPNFVEIAQTTEEICQFSMFQDGGRRYLEFLKFQNFNGRYAQRGRTASSCKIWSKSLKPRLRCGGRPPCWICNACVGTTHEGQLVVFITVQNLVEIVAVVLRQKPKWLDSLSNALDRQSLWFLSERVHVCPQIGCRRITSALFFTDFHQILYATLKCGCFERHCFWDKPEVDYRF